MAVAESAANSDPVRNIDSGVDGETETKETPMDKQTLMAVLQFLKKHNLKDTEDLLKKEAKLKDEELTSDAGPSSISGSDNSNAMDAYKSDSDPSKYRDAYQHLKNFIESSLDMHKCELSCVLYPVFAHMYLELIFNGHEQEGKEFFEKFSICQEDYHQSDLSRLSMVTKTEHMRDSRLLEDYRGSKFAIRLLRDSYNRLKRFLKEKNLPSITAIIDDHLTIDVFDGAPRNKQQIDSTSGAMFGDALKDANKAKVYFGLLKEPDINIPLDDDDDESAANEDGKPSKKRKARKDPMFTKKSKNDPNAPPLTRIPLPELKDSDKQEKVRAYREAAKRVTLGPENLPSICFYTVVNSYHSVTSIDISDDSSMMSSGFCDSTVHVWSVTPSKLRSIKQPSELELIDKEADDVMERIMDEKTASENRTLLGHSGPVYATSFSHDRNSLISASEDGSVRLWSLQTWTNLVSYKGHLFPVWDATFCSQGRYFATSSYDRTARLWATDHYQPLRIFAGHMSDVDCVRFHPNTNYIATGSTDRTVRLWDVLSGSCVRIMTGHKGPIHSLAFSPDGKFLASAGVDKQVNLWDISTGDSVAQLKGHTDTVHCLAFSREGSILASGGKDNCVKLWDVNKIFSDQDSEMGFSNTVTVDSKQYELGSYGTKHTPVLNVHFTRRNLLLASGPFVANA